MQSFGSAAAPAVVTAFDLSRFGHLVDVGGGSGHVAAAACSAYPRLRATVVDLPNVVATEAIRAYVDASPARDRIAFLGLDMFAEAVAYPSDEDLFVLARILHDWDEPACLALLKSLHGSLRPGGALLVAEKLLDDSKQGPLTAQLQSLNMLVQTRGRERSAIEYGVLLGRAGFRLAGAVRTGAYLDAILALRD